MHRPPSRPTHDITQPFGSGVVKIYSVADYAAGGLMPSPALDKLKVELRYDERGLGLRRYFTALENNVQVDRVIRVPAAVDISPQDAAVTEDGTQYRIDLVQRTVGVYPPSLDLTLTRIAQNWEAQK